MGIWQRLFSRKASEARSLVTLGQNGEPAMTPSNYRGYSEQGFQKNVIVHRAIGMIANACSKINWTLMQKSRSGAVLTEVESNPLLDLLQRPNPMQGRAQFFYSVAGYYLIAGNEYIEAVTVGDNVTREPIELWPHRPDRFTIIKGKDGYPSAYLYKFKDYSRKFPVDNRFRSNILHLHTFNPNDDWYGLSSIEAAMLGIDQNNAVNRWNLSLLQNSAVPSGVLEVQVNDANPTGTLTTEVFDRVKGEFNSAYSGSRNAGRAMLLEGGLKWTQLSLTPQQMHWVESKNTTARDIAMAFGIPPQMLNISGDNTYANYEEARLSFYEDTVLPLMDYIRDELNNWLTPRFGDRLMLDYDKDKIEALVLRRAKEYERVKSSDWLTVNEKREATGYETSEGWDVIYVPSGVLPMPLEEPDFVSTESTTDPVDDPANDEANTGNEEENDADEASEGTQGQAQDEADDAKHYSLDAEVKLFSAISQSAKRRSWHQQNLFKQSFERAMFADLHDDLIKQAQDLAKAVKGVAPDMYEFAIRKGVADSLPAIEATIRKHVRRGVTQFGGLVFADEKARPADFETKTVVRFNDFVQSFVESRTASAIKEIEGTSVKKARAKIRQLLGEALEEGASTVDIAKSLEAEFVGLAPSRARLIARTETQIASNQGSLEAAKALDQPSMKKEWVSAQDDRTRDDSSHANHLVMNGVQVGINEKFTVPPDSSMDGPGDPSAPIEQLANCRCVLVYST